MSHEPRKTMAAILHITIDPRLKELIGQKAEEAGVPMNEYVAKIIAEYVGKPKLAEIPRISIGRPRKKLQEIER